MPNTFDPDGKPDLMSPQDQLAYMRATGGTISGVQNTPSSPSSDVGTVDPDKAREYQAQTAAEDAARRSAPKVRKTSYGLPMAGKP